MILPTCTCTRTSWIFITATCIAQWLPAVFWKMYSRYMYVIWNHATQISEIPVCAFGMRSSGALTFVLTSRSLPRDHVWSYCNDQSAAGISEPWNQQCWAWKTRNLHFLNISENVMAKNGSRRYPNWRNPNRTFPNRYSQLAIPQPSNFPTGQFPTKSNTTSIIRY